MFASWYGGPVYYFLEGLELSMLSAYQEQP